MRWQIYICPTCKTRTTLQAEHYESTKEFEESLPESLPCIRRNCEDLAVP